MTERVSIYDRAQHRWRDILRYIGVPEPVLNGKHQGCPFNCGSQKDGFRFTDVDRNKQPGGGGYFCNGCGAGNGVDFVMKFKHVDFKGAAELIESVIGKAAVYVPKATSKDDSAKREAMAWLWKNRARPLTGEDIASRYLLARGIPAAHLPKGGLALRWVPDLPYYDDDGKKVGDLPCMLARVIAPDNSGASLHRTWLVEPGQKAPGNCRKMMGPVPEGGAVRLCEPAETMGVAEGIETALGAAALFGIPVWSTLTAGGLMKWVPPEGVKRVIIFADGDENHVGEEAAATLGRRLHKLKIRSRIRVPEDRYWEGKGADWLDVYLKGENHGRIATQDGKAA